MLNKPNGGITCGFHARDLHLVVGPTAPGMRVRFRVLIDGKPPSDAHGLDVVSKATAGSDSASIS
jgi:hypothetical protein